MKILRPLLFAAIAAILALAAAAPHAVAQQQGEIYCSQNMQYDAATSGATRIFTAVVGSSRQVYICGFIINVGATATNVQLKSGTGTTCGTNTANITPNWVLPIAGQVVNEQGVFHGIMVPAGQDVCLVASAGNAVQAMIYYTYQ